MKTNLISIIEHTPTFKGMKALKEKRVLTFDIESLIINGSHIPHIITIHTGQDPTFIFKINKKSLIKGNYNQEVNRLFKRVFKFLIKYSAPSSRHSVPKGRGVQRVGASSLSSGTALTIYVHNLGGYDGTFIVRELLKLDFIETNKLNILLDKHNKFIVIQYENIKFLDSCRLSGGQSLKDICKIWKVETPKLVSNNLWFTKDILLNENAEEYDKLLDYAKVDSESLYQCIYKATKYYYETFNVNFLDKVSTRAAAHSMSYAIWLKTVTILKEGGNSLDKSYDDFCRQGYYGGYTNFFKLAGQNLNHYDVNSLYPYAMLNERLCPPYQVDLDNSFSKKDNKPLLEDFFGFLRVKIINNTKYELRQLPPS